MSQAPDQSGASNDKLQYIILPYATNVASIYMALTLDLPFFGLALLLILNILFFGVATYTLMVGQPPGNSN